MNQKGFTPVFILVGVLTILVLGIGGFLVYNATTKKEISQQPSPSPRPESGFRQSEASPNNQQAPQTTSTAGWTTYTNPEFGYSLKIPPEWKEKIDSDNEQKRFRVYSPKGSSSDELGKFEAELQILTLPYNHPAVKDTRSEQERFQEVDRQLGLRPGVEETIEGMPVKKIKNVNLDGCEAPQFFYNEGGYKYGYSTGCLGKTRYLSLLLFADQQEIVERYKSIYDAVVASFKFNQFRL